MRSMSTTISMLIFIIIHNTGVIQVNAIFDATW